MSNVSKLKKKAADFEQKRQFDRAVQAYIELLDTLANDIDDGDIPLYNRVGDLLIRQNSASEALVYYEKAVDLYSERGFLNNAIALCNKILRQSPGRTIIYYKLGKISATKGFKSDAKRNFLEYADRMEKSGKRDEAFRALKEFADLCPDQDDVRLMLAEHLARDNRRDEAIEQLQTLHAKLETEGRSAEARATLDRMKAIDPEVEPKPSGAYKIVKSNELVFLDVDDVPSPRAGSTPSESVPAARAPQPEVSTPATDASAAKSTDATLDSLDLTYVDDDAAEPGTDAALIDGFTPTGEHERVDAGAVPRLKDFDTGRAPEEDLDLAFPSLIDVPAVGDDPNETVPLQIESFVDETLSETEFAALELEPLDEPIEERPHDLALRSELPLLRFTDEVAVVAEQTEIVQTPNAGMDLDSEIMPPITRSAPAPIDDHDFELAAEEVAELVEPDPLTLDAAAADLEDAAASLDEAMPPATPNEEGFNVEATMYPTVAGGMLPPDAESDEPAASGPAHQLEWEDLAEAAAAHTVEPMQLPAQPAETPTEESEAAAEAGEIDPHFLDRVPTFGAVPTPTDDSFSPIPLSLDTLTPDETATEHRAPISQVAASHESVEQATEKGLRDRPEPARAVEAKSLVQTLREQVEATPNDGRLRRRFAEALLDTGEREQGLRELDAAMRWFEVDDIETARDIANEILRLVPESVRHHQKCVEYAVRSGDRAQLIEAYVALADALFRGGEHTKAQAVYSRVVELEPNESRSLHALELLAGRTPSEGVPPAVAAPPPVQADGPEPGDPSFEDLELEDLDAEVAAAFQLPDESPGNDHGSDGNGVRPDEGFTTPAFVSSGDFIDLGAMLRGDQPEKSTRMVVGDAKPTGDEQADFEDMLRRFKQGVAANVDDEDFDSHYDLGVAFKEMGLVDDAIAQFQKALRSDTHRSRAYEALGQCFIEKQQHHVAATLLKRAVETTQVDDRVLVGSLYLLGYACEQLQRDREALVYYQRVFAVDVDFRDVATRIRALESQAAS